MKEFELYSVCLVFVKGESVLIFDSSSLMTFIKPIIRYKSLSNNKLV